MLWNRSFPCVVIGSLPLLLSCDALAGNPGCYPLSIESTTPLNGVSGNSFTIIDQFALVGSYTGGVQIFDISDSTSPQPVTSIPDAIGVMHIHGDTLFASPLNPPGGIRVYDVSDPSAPVFLVEMDASLTDNVTHFESDGDFLYVSEAFDDMVRIFDVHDPSSPSLVSSIQASFPRGLAARGANLYVSVGGSGVGTNQLEVYDVSDPASPIMVAGMTGAEVGEVLDIEIQGTTVFLAGGFEGFSTIDVSDPTNPVLMDSDFYFGTSGILTVALDVTVDGDFAYVSQFSEDFDGQNSVFAHSFGIIDFSDPSSLRGINWISLPSTPGREAAVIRSGLAYVATSSEFLVVDVTDQCACTADLNGDGVLNFFDVSAFINQLLNGDPAADLTGDGELNFFDVSVFLNAFNAGCP